MSFDKPHDYVSPDAVEVMLSAESLQARLAGLAHEIAAGLGQEFLMVGLLKGSFVFMADLVRALHLAGCRPQVDFMTLSSYGAAKESSGTVTLGRGLADDVSGKPALLVDDILETGRTLCYARNHLLEHGASRVQLCTLLDKPSRRAEAMDADYVGFTIEDRFVVGYGLDYAGYYRELPFIGVL